ncbi:MAG: ATP-binding protein [Bacteroidales bacterium]|nr:ATP-binding protein [Bacteroidales bacterium]
MGNNRFLSRNQKEAIRQFLKLTGRGDGSREYINSTLEVIGSHYDADRAYIFEPHEIDGFITNSYEWCRDGVVPQIDNLKLVPEAALVVWYDRFMRQGSFYVEVNDELAKNDPNCYEILVPQGISSIMTAPLFKSGNVVGMVGVDNPRRNVGHKLLLSVIASSLHAELIHIRTLETEADMKRRLQEAYDKAEQANAAKTVFLSNMSHDIRTPMNAIIGFAGLMRQHLESNSLASDYLAKIQKSSEYLLSIINNVLDIARIDSGKATLDLDCFDLTDKSHTLSMFDAIIAEKHLDFKAEQHIEHRYVLMDRVKVHQVVVNLLSNAFKYTPDGGKVRFVMKEVPCSREGYMRVVSTISDNGIGMSKDFLKRVFENFSRERNTTDSKVVGTGLGMSIVKKLVDLMDGNIELDSEPGKGTTVTITMEHAIVTNPEHYLKKSVAVAATKGCFSSKRILLAEDNDLNAEIATSIMEEAGLVVECVADGVECIKKISEMPAGYYNAILMDIQMPNLNGYEATMRIRQLPDREKASVPIVAMTANAFDEDRKNSIAAGMDSHLTKPIEVDKLMAVLSKLLS